MFASKTYLTSSVVILIALMLSGCPTPDGSFAGPLNPPDPGAGGGGDPTLIGELEVQVSDGGMVTSDPDIITCVGLFPTQFCFVQAPIGLVVTLTAVPAAGFRFTLWDNCPGPAGLTCVLTMNTAVSVRANFDVEL